VAPRRPTPVSTDPLIDEIRTVRDLVEETLGVLTYNVQDPDALIRREQEIRKVFGRGKKRADVFLALSKDLNVSEVAAETGMKRQNVAIEIRRLHEAGLAMPLATGGRGDVWVRNPLLERIHGLTAKVANWRAEM
jgi:hypothetical protein